MHSVQVAVAVGLRDARRAKRPHHHPSHVAEHAQGDHPAAFRVRGQGLAGSAQVGTGKTQPTPAIDRYRKAMSSQVISGKEDYNFGEASTQCH